MAKRKGNGFWVGVDVAKATFEASVAPTGSLPAQWAGLAVRSFENTAQGALELVAWVSEQPGRCEGVCLESTGVYSQRLSRLLEAGGLSVSVVNPARPLAFGRSIGLRDKSDRIDAAVLALYGVVHQPQTRQTRMAQAGRLRPLWRLREDCVELVKTTRQRLEQADDPFVVRRLRKTLREAERSVTEVESEIRKALEAEGRMKHDAELLQTIPGIGEVTSWVLLAELGDLRQWARNEVVGFAGVFPREHSSGSSVWKRPRLARGWGGRLRRALFMAAFALRSKPAQALNQFAQRLVDRGKPKMCAIGALMRKLLLVARAVVCRGKPYEPQLIGLGDMD